MINNVQIKIKKKYLFYKALYSFCDYRMQFCRGELKRLTQA